jgi:flagellar protein FlaG
MTNEIGSIKAVFPPAAQIGSTASVTHPADVEREQADNKSVDKAEKAAPAQEPLDEVVSELNNLVRELHRELRFAVDDASGEVVVKVVDSETDEVVRQIPGEEVVRLRQRLQENAGIIFQDSA